MDVCLTNYGHCNYVSGKHACIFYDEVRVRMGLRETTNLRPHLGPGLLLLLLFSVCPKEKSSEDLCLPSLASYSPGTGLTWTQQGLSSKIGRRSSETEFKEQYSGWGAFVVFGRPSFNPRHMVPHVPQVVILEYRQGQEQPVSILGCAPPTPPKNKRIEI